MRERAVRMVAEMLPEYATEHEAIRQGGEVLARPRDQLTGHAGRTRASKRILVRRRWRRDPRIRELADQAAVGCSVWFTLPSETPDTSSARPESTSR